MRHKLLSAILVTAVLIGLSACQSKQQPVPQPVPQNLPTGAEPFSKGPTGPPAVRGPSAPPGASPVEPQAVTEKESINFTLPADNQ